MKKLLVLFILFFSLTGSAWASYYSNALKTPSPLAPANKPFKNQLGYATTAQFKNLASYNNLLAKKVKAKESYSPKAFSDARAATNKKLTNNIKAIGSLQAEATTSIKTAFSKRVDLLKDGLWRDYQVGFQKIKSGYFANLKKIATKRNIAYAKTKRVTLAKLNKAYTSSKQKAVRSRYQSTMKKIRESYYLNVKTLRNKTKSASDQYFNKFKSQLSEVYSGVKSQASSSIDILNKRTTAQILILKNQKLKSATYLKRLGKKSSVSLLTLTVSKASLGQVTTPLTYPSAPVVLADWPDLKTPKKYIIPSNYLPGNVIAFQKEQVKNICLLGSGYLSNLKKGKQTASRLKGIQKSLSYATKNVANLNKEYQKARSNYLEKKRVYNKEQKIRLQRPNDDWLNRAKNRYLEAKRSLASAKSAVEYAQINVKDIAKVYKVTKNRADSYYNTAQSYKIKQNRLIKKTELFKQAKKSCPSKII